MKSLRRRPASSICPSALSRVAAIPACPVHGHRFNARAATSTQLARKLSTSGSIGSPPIIHPDSEQCVQRPARLAPRSEARRPCPAGTPSRPLPRSEQAAVTGLPALPRARRRHLPAHSCPEPPQGIHGTPDRPDLRASADERKRALTAPNGGYARCWPRGSTTLGGLLADGQTGGQLAEPPGTVPGSIHPPATGVAGRRGWRLLPMRQAMTLTFSAWGPFWPWVMSSSTFCPSSRLR